MSKQAVVALLEHLGDMIAAEPIARRLKADGYQVTWVTSDRYRELVDADKDVAKVLTVSCLSEWAAFPQERYDLVADLHFDQRLCSSTNKPIAKRFGDRSVSLENYLDYGSLLGAFCATAGLPPLSDAPLLHVRPGPPALKGDYAVMHCAPNELERMWSRTNWRMLAYDVAVSGLPIVEIGGTSTLDGMRGVTDKTGILSVGELAGIIAGARIFIGCESGPAHIANALRKDSLIVTGSYRKWKSYNVWTGFLKDNPSCVISPGVGLGILPYPMVRTLLMGKLSQRSP